ncbi:unnamed protein product [Alopecurus aequalis]
MQAHGGGGGGGEAGDMRGRHRIQAELKKLEQEARFLEHFQIATRKNMVMQPLAEYEGHEKLKIFLLYEQDELEELDKTDKVSAALQEFRVTIERKADPLLPVTTGAAYQSWDRWFEGPQDLRTCKCWFL